MSDDSRDILIELRADMRHVREKVDDLTGTQKRQWEKIDANTAAISRNEGTITFLVWGFRLLIGGLVTGSIIWKAFAR